MADKVVIPAGKPGTGNQPTEQEQKQPTLAEVLEQPLTEDEARKLLAQVDVQLAQLQAFRVQKTLELNKVDEQIAAAQFDKAVIYRRVLNKPAEQKPAEAK